MIVPLLFLVETTLEVGAVGGVQIDTPGGRGSAGFSRGFALGPAFRVDAILGRVSLGLALDVAWVGFWKQYGYDASSGWRADLIADTRFLFGSPSVFEHGPSVGVVIRRTSPEQTSPSWDPAFMNYGVGAWYSTTGYFASTASPKVGFGQRTGCQVGMSGLSEHAYRLDTLFYSCDVTVFIAFRR